MPTIYDIPKHLLSADKKEEFIGWVKQLPSETWVKRDLARLWSGMTKVRFEALDYNKMGL